MCVLMRKIIEKNKVDPLIFVPKTPSTIGVKLIGQSLKRRLCQCIYNMGVLMKRRSRAQENRPTTHRVIRIFIYYERTRAPVCACGRHSNTDG